MNETPLIQIDYLTVICGIQDHQQTCFRAQMIHPRQIRGLLKECAFMEVNHPLEQL